MRGCVNGLSLLVAAVVSSAGLAQTSAIRLPVAPVAPTPAPAPAPDRLGNVCPCQAEQYTPDGLRADLEFFRQPVVPKFTRNILASDCEHTFIAKFSEMVFLALHGRAIQDSVPVIIGVSVPSQVVDGIVSWVRVGMMATFHSSWAWPLECFKNQPVHEDRLAAQVYPEVPHRFTWPSRNQFPISVVGPNDAGLTFPVCSSFACPDTSIASEFVSRESFDGSELNCRIVGSHGSYLVIGRGLGQGWRMLVASVQLASILADQQEIRIPILPQKPEPAPSPKAVSTLASGEIYVIDSDKPLIVLASPDGIVKTTTMDGPVTIFGKFVDGNGGYEKRVANGKQVVTVEAVTTGRVELLIVPVGSTAAKDVIRVMLDVTGARPPPGPTPDPKPPEPKPPEPVKSFRVLFVYESGDTLTAAQHSVMYGKTVSDYLNAKTTPDGKWAGWRRFDKDDEAANETASIKALWAAVKPQLTGLPCVVIEVNGKAEILPFPDSPAAALALFKKYGGDK